MPSPAPHFSTPASSATPLEEARGVVLELEEFCGLAHETQVVVFAANFTSEPVFSLRNTDGRLFPAQRSKVHPDKAFLQISLKPFEKIALSLSPKNNPAAIAVSQGIIQSGSFSLEVPVGTDRTLRSGFATPGPVKRFRIGDTNWRGRSFLDTRQPVELTQGEFLEEGPVRVVYRYRVELQGGGFYQALLTVDAGLPFARIEEEFQAGVGDQIVWDFFGPDQPTELLSLDSSASYRIRPLSYHYDTRQVRLAAWTQQSQHLDLVDGFALSFPGGEALGFVALEGSRWRGDKLNHLEAWVRRWLPNEPVSRREVPAEAKADSSPGPERVPARGGVVCQEHFNVEGWIGQGKRLFALVPTTREAIQPADPSPQKALEHFEDIPDRPRYRQQQSSLRRIQIQHGVLPLQTQLESVFAWPLEEPPQAEGFVFPNEVLDQHFKTASLDPKVVAREMQEYLAARVYGFWEGSGIAYSNPVASRRIAPEMFRYEWLIRQDVLSAEEQKLLRAHFAFLSTLFFSENYYTGERTMLPAESPDTTEPTLAGMANQNFYTDVINIFGGAAQIFHQHPSAPAWRERFIRQWHRQLAFHMYPESGLWEESHTYYQHVLHTVLPTLLRRRADGVDNEFANPALQKLAASALRQITPRDTALGGRRYLIAFGDHGRHPQPALFAVVAQAFAGTNEELAKRLAWLSQEMRGPGGPAPAAWENEAVQGLGIMFRGRDSQGVETLLAFRSGNAWGHHHNDDGSLQFFAKGHCLIGDSAFGENQPAGQKFSAAGHSRWTLRDLQPVNHFWRFNRGWITNAELSGRFAHARGNGPVFTVRGGLAETEILPSPVLHGRSVLQLDAVTYLIVDTSRSSWPQVVRFHLAGKQAALDGERATLDFPGGRLTIAPLFSGTPLRATLTRPLVDGEQATTEAAYDMGLRSFAAFVLHAGDPGESFDLNSSGHTCVIRTKECETEVRRQPDDHLVVTDLGTGQKTTLYTS